MKFDEKANWIGAICAITFDYFVKLQVQGIQGSGFARGLFLWVN